MKGDKPNVLVGHSRSKKGSNGGKISRTGGHPDWFIDSLLESPMNEQIPPVAPEIGGRSGSQNRVVDDVLCLKAPDKLNDTGNSIHAKVQRKT